MARYAGRAIEDHDAETRIMPDYLTVVLGGEVVLHDGTGDPISPSGWWEAVGSFEDRAHIVLLPISFPMTQEHTRAELGHRSTPPIPFIASPRLCTGRERRCWWRR